MNNMNIRFKKNFCSCGLLTSSFCQAAVLPGDSGDGWQEPRIIRRWRHIYPEHHLHLRTVSWWAADMQVMFDNVCYKRVSKTNCLHHSKLKLTFVWKDLPNRQFCYGWSVKIQQCQTSLTCLLRWRHWQLTTKTHFPATQQRAAGPCSCVRICKMCVSSTQGFGHHCRGEFAPYVSLSVWRGRGWCWTWV